MSHIRRIARAAGLMSLATFISRVLGYLRDMVIAFHFGATGLSDTFFVAFRIPNLLRELFAEGSISSAVVPVLTEYQKKDEKEASRLTRVTLGFILTVVGATCLLGIFFAPQVVTVIAPGFLDSPEQFKTTVLLTRVMFPFLLFVSLAALSMGALNTRGVFFIPALAPAVLNVVIIMTVFLLATRLGQPILAVAIGVALGGLMQFLFQCPALIKKGYSVFPIFDFRDPGLRKMLRLVLPVTLGMAVAQINIVVSNILASFLPEGSITYLFYSMRLIQFPIGVFGVAMAMAVLPSLSDHALKRDFDSLREDFSFSLRLLFFICVPAMVGLIALREPIVNLLFQRGRFDHAATAGTAEALLYYSLGIWAMVGVKVVAATFYSMQDTKTPVKAAVTALLANVVLSLALMGPLKHSGLALANALSSMLNFTLLFYFLKMKLGRVGARKILHSVFKCLLASGGMAAVCLAIPGGEIWGRAGEFPVKTLYLSGTIALAAGAYAILSRILGSEELGFVWRSIKEKLNAGTKGKGEGTPGN
jgi:putative peptidoglycan lipid II flippase